MEQAPQGNLNFGTMKLDELVEWVLRREQFSMRRSAIRVLAERMIEDPDSLGHLTGALEDVDPSTRRRAVQTLGFCGKSARALLPEMGRILQSDPIWTVREAAAHAVHCLCWPSPSRNFSATVPLQQLLESSLQDRETLVREACIQGLAACVQDDLVDDSVKASVWNELKAGSKHPHASRRCRAVTALCRLAEWDPLAIPEIASGLRDSHWKVRRTTARRVGEHPQIVLSESGRRWILPELVKRQFDQNLLVQKATRETLHRLQTGGNGPKIENLLRWIGMHFSPFAILHFVLTEVKLSEEGEAEFRQICRRRLKWQAENFGAGALPICEEVVPLGELVEQVQRQADKGDKQLAFKETVWLLVRWVECYLGKHADS